MHDIHAEVRTLKDSMANKITAPRGTQDIFPPRSADWLQLETRIHDLARRYGYGEIRTPMFEATELFERGVGDTTDIVEKEMYTFMDKGDRSMTLRPEWTAPVVRAALENSLYVLGPSRMYYVGPFFRYERPAKGRFRQAHQFGIECVGFKGPEADLEVISLAWELIREHGLTDAALNINSIGDDVCRPRYRDALLAHFRPHAAELSADSQRRLERNPLRLLDSKDEKDRVYVESAPTFESVLCDECRHHFETLKALLSACGIPFVVNPRIVRGLDYYTRTVFEITSNSLGAQSTVCGGGRYDGLIKSLGGPDLPAVGFGLGLERFLMMLDAIRGDVTPARSGVQAIALGVQARTTLVPFANELRRHTAMPVFMDFDDRKLQAQFKVADRNNARFALILGADELAAGEIVLRNLEAREDRKLPLRTAAELAAALDEAGR